MNDREHATFQLFLKEFKMNQEELEVNRLAEEIKRVSNTESWARMLAWFVIGYAKGEKPTTTEGTKPFAGRLIGWSFNAGGGVSGKVFGSPKYKDGVHIHTSHVTRITVETENSTYDLVVK